MRESIVFFSVPPNKLHPKRAKAKEGISNSDQFFPFLN